MPFFSAARWRRPRPTALRRAARPLVEELEHRCLLAIFTVNSPLDPGADGVCNAAECTLREAIDASNGAPGPDTINFNIGGGGLQTINLQPGLQPLTITDPVAIEGTTQPGFVDTPLIELNGNNAAVFGLAIQAGPTTVRGLIINRTRMAAIALTGGNGNAIRGNFLGTDSKGTAAPGNGDGVLILDSANNTIGGTVPADRNVISGNRVGVFMRGPAAMGNVVQRNFIGTNVAGTGALPNMQAGVLIEGGSGNTIGGPTVDLGNTIAFNQGIGVAIVGGTSNTISHNSMFSNAALGIDLDADGITANDGDDSDGGANGRQNFPDLTQAFPGSVAGTLTSTPGMTYRLEFFANDVCDATGNGEGAGFLADLVLPIPAGGTASFGLPLSALVPVGTFITATATDPLGNTSEFARCAVVVPAADLSVTKDDATATVIAGDGLIRTYTISVANAGPSDATGVTLSDTWPTGFARGTITPPLGSTCVDAGGGPNFDCDLGTIAPGTTKAVTVTYTVPASTPAGDQTNTASVVSPVIDPTPTNNSAADTNTVATSADLAVAKSDGVTSVTAGDAVTRTYTITVTNGGPSDAAGVTLNDTWPAGFTRGAVTPPAGSTCTDVGGGPSFNCDLGSIAAGTSKIVRVSYTLPAATAAGTQTNSASVTSAVADPDATNNTAADTNTVGTSADLSVTKSDGVTTVTAGDGILRTYTITVSNAGPSDATGVTLSDTWPGGFARGAIAPPAGSTCADVGGGPSFTCDLATIAAGTSKTVTVQYTVPASTAAGTQTDTASVTATTGDPDATNNSAADTNTVGTSADVSVTKSDGVTTVTAGDGIVRSYTIIVSNAGPSDATGVTLSDTWPGGFARGAIAPPAGSTCADVGGGPSFTCDLATIAAGTSKTVTVQYTVPASTAAGTQTDTASVTATTGDPDATNNSAADTNTVGTSADLSVAKSDGVATVTAGDGVTRTYTIIVSNTGPSDATGVTLSDTWPGGFARGVIAPPAGSTCTDVGGGPSFTCDLATIAAGTSKTVTVRYTVPASTAAGTQTDTASVTSATSDPDATNNSALDTNTVGTSADLSVTKSDGVATVTAGDGVVRTYMITVSNAGPSDATAVTLSDTWPSGFARGVIAPPAGSTCADVGGGPSFSCDLDTIAAGTSKSVTVRYTVPASTAAGTQTDTASVTATTGDPDATNNSAVDTNTVGTSADLSVTKSDGVTTVTAGDGVTRTYTIVVSNTGPSDAAGVTLSDAWPAGFTRGAITPPAGSTCMDVAGGPSFDCDLGTIAAGTSKTVTVTYSVPAATAAGPQANRASVTSGVSDPDGSDNTAGDITTVASGTDIDVRLFTSAGPATLGDLAISYEILGGPASPFELVFFSSADAAFDLADAERGPRVPLAAGADLALGMHTIMLPGAAYAPFLTDPTVPFFLTRAVLLPGGVAEPDLTDNHLNFVGIFHPAAVPAPLVIRGRDGSDRLIDDPDDVVTLAGAADVTITSSFTTVPVTVPGAGVSEIVVLGLGGTDSFAVAATLARPLRMQGGDGDDVLTGGAAADVLLGGPGDDTLVGGPGDDMTDGEAGIDTADFSAAMAGVSVNLKRGTARGRAIGKDVLAAIENVIGSAFKDKLVGNDLSNRLLGGDGADSIKGAGGDDVLSGDAGNDSLFGELGADVLLGGLGNDLCCGGIGDDMLSGGDGDDSLGGETGLDVLLGGLGFDLICADAAEAPDFGGVGADGGRLV